MAEATATSVFEGEEFDPEAFVRQICRDNPTLVGVVRWLLCVSEDRAVLSAKFYRLSEPEAIMEDLEDDIQWMEGEGPAEFDGGVLSQNYDNGIGGRAAIELELVNCPPALEAAVRRRIGAYTATPDGSDVDAATSDA